MKLHTIILLFVFSVFTMSSTSYARYKADLFKKTSKEIDTCIQEYVSFDCEILDSQDCKKYFNSYRLIEKGYQPIYITFINNSKNSISVGPESFSFRCAHALDVANNLHRNGAIRGIGFGLGALLFIPLIIPALVQGFGAYNYNEIMDIDFLNKAFKKQLVPPYTIVEGIIFVPVDEFSKDFILTITDISKKESYKLFSLESVLVV